MSQFDVKTNSFNINLNYFIGLTPFSFEIESIVSKYQVKNLKVVSGYPLKR